MPTTTKKFYEFTYSYQKIHPSGALVHGVPEILTPMLVPNESLQTEYGDDAQEEGRDLGGHPEGGRAGQDSVQPKVLTFLFWFFSGKKRLPQHELMKTTLSFEQSFLKITLQPQLFDV